ncbi:hypothetical protein QBC35DRAFT_394917 [Podospora australis]|uniref:Transmembrane protein n=1 Tax=Podospora australis TaxID=1536484 RepID=A0AAN6WKC1_9PEZI|nr:hypothetical protein QBC35DRAFT_394917 [Podospora australis]
MTTTIPQDTVAWRKIVLWLLFGVWIGSIFFGLIYLSVWGAVSSAGSACKPDGSFSPFFDDDNWWSRAGFFQITLRVWPRLSFTQAKFIDVACDLVIGRGGQGLIGYISWKVFANFIAVSMQRKPVSYRTYHAVFIRQESSFLTVYRLLCKHGVSTVLGSRVATVFMATTLCWILAFPTLTSAMTGYTANTEPFVRDISERSNYKPFQAFDIVAYTLRNSNRVNLTEPYFVRYRFDLGSPAEYGFRKETEAESKWDDKMLPSPLLYIDAFYIPPKIAPDLYGHDWWDSAYDWTDPIGRQFPFRNKSETRFVSGNQFYPLEYVRENGRCQPVAEEYGWGFSFLQLQVSMVVLLVWSVGVYIMWLHSNFNLPLTKYDEVPKDWACVMHMAATLSRDLKAQGLDAEAVTDRQLKTLISELGDGGSISFGAELEHDAVIGIWRAIGRWVNMERWWTLASGLHICVVIAAILLHLLGRRVVGFFVLSCLSCFSVYFVMALGNTKLIVFLLPVYWIALLFEGLRVSSVI